MLSQRIKAKLSTARKEVVTYFKEEGPYLAASAAIGVGVAVVYALVQHTKQIEQIGRIIDLNAAAGNYNNENVWYLPDGDASKARRVALPMDIVLSNPTE